MTSLSKPCNVTVSHLLIDRGGPKRLEDTHFFYKLIWSWLGVFKSKIFVVFTKIIAICLQVKKIKCECNPFGPWASRPMHYCDRGAHPLRIVQVWKIISQHQIIVQKWIFLCLTRTLVRIIGNFLKVFSFLKIGRKSIKT